MIEPSGTPISLPPNRQVSKAPGGGAGHTGIAVAPPLIGPTQYPQAQSDKGFGSIGTEGFSDQVPPVLAMGSGRLDPGVLSAQDKGSMASKVGSFSGEINKGTPEQTAHTPLGGSLRAGTPTESQVDTDPGVTGRADTQADLVANPRIG